MTPVGPPIWADLAVADIDAECAFYSRLLGWAYLPTHPDAGGWRQATKDGAAAAGIAPRPPGMSISAWTLYFGTPDINAGVAWAEGLGAAVLAPPMNIDIDGERMCSIAILADPTGAVFGLMQPGVHTGFGFDSGHGAAVWYELMSRDKQKAVDFYTAMLGATSALAPDVPMEYVLISVDGKEIGGVMDVPEQVPAQVPSNWGVIFAVDDAVEAVRLASESGATVLMGPETINAGTLAALMDPDGAAVSIIQLPEPE